MIAGIGIDLTTVSRMAKAHSRFGERFARRFLHSLEMPAYYRQAYVRQPQAARFLAKRFAVKEAAVKALGTGERQGVLLKHFYLQHDALGKPILQVSGVAASRCRARGIESLWVSLCDEGDTVAAVVVLECNSLPSNSVYVDEH